MAVSIDIFRGTLAPLDKRTGRPFIAPVPNSSCAVLTKAAVFLEYIRYLAYAGMSVSVSISSVDTMLTEHCAVFSLMRGYALTRRWIIATVIFALSLAPLAVNMVCDSGALTDFY